MGAATSAHGNEVIDGVKKNDPSIQAVALDGADDEWKLTHGEFVTFCKSLETNEHILQVSINWQPFYPAGASGGCLAPQVIGSVQALADMMKINSSIRVLSVTYSSLEDEGLALLGAALESNKTLKGLILEKVGGSSVGMKSLLASLAKRDNLALLSIKNFPDLSESAEEMRQLLMANRGMKTLSLENDDLTPAFLATIEPALTGHPTMESLSFAAGKLGDEGAAIMARLIVQDGPGAMTKLNEFSVGCNVITLVGGNVLLAAMRLNKRIHEAKVGENFAMHSLGDEFWSLANDNKNRERNAANAEAEARFEAMLAASDKEDEEMKVAEEARRAALTPEQRKAEDDESAALSAKLNEAFEDAADLSKLILTATEELQAAFNKKLENLSEKDSEDPKIIEKLSAELEKNIEKKVASITKEYEANQKKKAET